MVKKNVLTPVLAGVLGVAVVGSGIGYYNVYVKDKVDTDKDAKKSNKDKTTVITIDEATQNIEESLDKAQQVAKGELDAGYKAEINYTAPSSGELAEAGVKNVGMSVEAKQKDKMSGVDYSLNYDSKGVITMKVVYDNDNETAYFQIPELSDAYLTGTAEDIAAMAGDTMYGSYDSYSEASGVETPDLSALEDIDFTALFDDLETYADTVKENAPEAKDGEDRTVEGDGVSITVTTKTYTITEADAAKVINAVADKGKNDTVIKDILTQMGMSSDEYNELWDEMTADLDAESDSDESITLDVYYIGDEVAGFNVKNDESGEQGYMIVASDETHIIYDCDFSDLADETFTMKGTLTYENETLDGSVVLNMEQSGGYDFETGESTSEPVTVTMKYDKLKITDDSATGTITVTANDGDETVEFSYTFNNSGDDVDMTFTGNVLGEDIGSVNIKVTKTDASDITVPSGTMYKISDEEELQKYAESCDIEGWQESLKNTLGDELYESLFGSSYDYDDYDYDYNYDDYDLDDYDFGSYNFDDYDFSTATTDTKEDKTA